LSAANIEANARSIAEYLVLGPDERSLASLPLHYSYGLSVLNSHLTVGATVVLTDEPVTARAFWTLVKDARITSMAGVPTTWDILRQIRFARMTIPTLSYCTQAGGRLSNEVTQYYADWARSARKRFYVMYGQTEATARIAFVPPERLPDKIGSVGIAIPGGALSLVDVHGHIITESGQTGEIVYRGPNVMLGYAESAEDLARGDECGGVLRTGDLARRDSDGYYFIVGRTKRFAKLFGNRINLDEVEALLHRHGIVNAVTQREERLLIGVEQADPDHVLRLVCAELQIHQSGARVMRLGAVPRSSSGKVQYPALEQMFEAPGNEPGSLTA